MIQVFFATSNEAKVVELQALLPEFEVRSLRHAPVDMPEETGQTFEANAILKAEAARDALGGWAVADDSGLEVDALGGAPGVRSARYAPGSDEDRCRALLQHLVGLQERRARFVCALALARPHGTTQTVRGTCEGRIGTEMVGSEGFGYDPVFVLEDGRTMATLSREQKNQVSHRGAALRKLKPLLERCISDGRSA